MRCKKGTDSFVFLFSFLINWDYFWFIKVIEWSKSQTPTYADLFKSQQYQLSD